LATILGTLQLHDKTAARSLEEEPADLTDSAVSEYLPSGQAFLSKALKTLEQNMSDPDFSVIQFCREMGMSQARVYRKLIALTGMSITQFIRNIRLKKAAEMLLETDLSISEVAYQTGFSNPGYFTKCFKEEFGKNPREFTQNNKRIH
jgi:transcriptional regulator GlxA family with amidase domain